jgi:hypothetical protein
MNSYLYNSLFYIQETTMRRLVNYGVFYAVWISMILGETYAWAIAGYAVGYIFFVAGGIYLARFHNRRTEAGESPFGWPLRFARKITIYYPSAGLAVNTLLNGAPGVGLVETSLGCPWRKVRNRAMIAAVGYATLWLIIHYVRPHSAIPIYWYPSPAALEQLWRVLVTAGGQIF